MKSLRLFIAMDFSSQVISEVTQFQNQLRKELGSVPIRWVAPEAMHLTLQFLGDVPVNHIDAIQAAIANNAAVFSAISLHLGGAGSFPSFKKPQVLWVGIRADKRLKQLAQRLQSELEPLGFKPESEFVPHLTLGRLNHNANLEHQKAVSAALARWQSIDIGDDQPQEIILYKSDLTQNGPVYTALFRAPLKNMLN